MALYDAIFFDTSEADDLLLLHSSIRTHDELDNVVDQVEWELIDAFSQREGQATQGNYDAFFDYEAGNDPNSEIKVRLVGYDSDAPADSSAGLQTALKRTIADIVSWVLRDYSNSQGIASISQGVRSITYSGTVPSWREWPDGWDKRLHNYDARFQNWIV